MSCGVVRIVLAGVVVDVGAVDSEVLLVVSEVFLLSPLFPQDVKKITSAEQNSMLAIRC
jgi:hypothetical protein